MIANLAGGAPDPFQHRPHRRHAAHCGRRGPGLPREPGKSNFGKALFLANTFASNITAGGFLTATIPNPIAIGMIVAALGTAASVTSWGFGRWPPYPPRSSSHRQPVRGALALPARNENHPRRAGIWKPNCAPWAHQPARKKGPALLQPGAHPLASDMWHHFNSTMVALWSARSSCCPRWACFPGRKRKNPSRGAVRLLRRRHYPEQRTGPRPKP